MNEKQLKEFRESLEKAVELMELKGAQIDKLMEGFDDLERKFLTMKSDMDNLQISKGGVLGFSDGDTAKNFVDFCSAVFVQDAETAKNMSEGTDSEGGYLVPPEFRAVLLRLVEVYGIIRPQCTVVPMSREEMNIPSLSSGVTVYWPGEGAAINQSQPVFGNLKLVAKKMAALTPVTNELIEDSSIAIANLLATLFAEAVAEEEDRIALAGDVSGASDPFDGILFASGVTEVSMATDSFADIDADDLADLQTAVTAAASKGAKYFMHRTVFNVVRKLKDSNGNYIYQAPAGNEPGTIWGYPYELVDVMPALTDSAGSTSFVIFGNPRHIHLGDRNKMTIARSQHYGFANDLTYLRAIERIAIEVGIPGAFSRLKTAATASTTTTT